MTSILEASQPADTGVRSAQLPPLAERLIRLHPAIFRCGHAAGTRLYDEDEPIDRLYVLAEGWALKSKALIDGRRQILDFAIPGDVLGAVCARRASYGVEMLTAGVVVVVPRDLFAAVAHANPDLALEVCRQREDAERRAYERIASISCRSARPRVCRLLVELAERPRPPGATAQDLHLRLPLRQIHIADALGMRVETVCRVLVQLARSGIACLKGGRLSIPDLDALRAEAEREDPPPASAVATLMPGGGVNDPESPAPSGGARRGRPGRDAAGRGMNLGEESLRQA